MAIICMYDTQSYPDMQIDLSIDSLTGKVVGSVYFSLVRLVSDDFQPIVVSAYMRTITIEYHNDETTVNFSQLTKNF